MKRVVMSIGLACCIAASAVVHAAGDAQAGKTKADSCAGCHGQNGEGTASGPALAGTAEDKFVQAIGEFKAGKRTNAAMRAFARKLSDQDTADLAAYYASLKK
jgi:cytochrome c553